MKLFSGISQKRQTRKNKGGVEMMYFAGGAEKDAVEQWVSDNGGVLTGDGDDFKISFNSRGINSMVTGTAPGWVFLNSDKSFEFTAAKR